MNPNMMPTEQETNVYVRIHAVIDDVRALGDVLTAKVDREGVDFTPTESAVRRSDTCTFCTLTCSTPQHARVLRQLLLEDRDRYAPLIDCSLTEFDQEGVQWRERRQEREELRRQCETELDTRSEQILRQHNTRLEDLAGKIDAAKAKLTNLFTHKQTKEEITALEHKQDEFEKQQEEFLRAVDGFRAKLQDIWKMRSFERDVQVLRKRFGVECCRLERPLPMYARKQDIMELVTHNQVSIILAETGSGKSTQVVQYLLETDLADRGTIVCTQPRKVAAVSLATHVAKELASDVGGEVGYKAGSRVRIRDVTKVVFMTDHAFLNECLADPDLTQFSCVVVDEAHERSLYTDLLLAMLKRCLGKRPELRVIITSATIDPQVFVAFFGGQCPIMKVSGRTFPVEVHYQDVKTEENEFENYVDAAVRKAIEIHTGHPPGDVLVFLTSPVEIDKCCETFQQTLKDRSDFQCFPLHGQLQADEQQKVFEPLVGNKRKIVFATNCAETSITIDGIRYVVDTGVAKELRYDARKNVNSLAVSVISRSSADQRKGRAGRTAPGTCYRLYSQRSFQDMEAISLPEILKTHLGQALLKLAELGVGPDMYDFVQSPSPDAITGALQSLVQLGAMQDGKITDTGRWMARLPFDPKLGLLTLLGQKENILYDAIVLAAVMSAGSNVFYRGTTPDEQEKQEKSKAKFSHLGGDSLTALAVYMELQAVPDIDKNKWCVENSVNAKVMRGAKDTVKDVLHILKREVQMDVERKFSEADGRSDLLQRMIFQCFFSNLCHYLGQEKAGFFAARAGRQVFFHPSSALNSLAATPEWVVYDQLTKTSRDFIMGITPVQASWLSDVKKEHLEFDVDQIRRMTLHKVYTQAVGTHAFFRLVGPRYSKMAEYEEQYSTDASSVLAVEASRETGEVRVFSTHMTDRVRELTQVLSDTVRSAVTELENEDMELPVGKEESRVRVVLGSGAQVQAILMATESRRIFVTRPSEDADEDHIVQKFRQFGDIRRSQVYTNSDKWGFLVFKTVEQARAAVEGTKDDDSDVGQAEVLPPARQHAEFRARLSWCRRPSRGFGNARVSPAYLSSCLVMGSFYVGNSLVKIQNDRKNANSLYLTGLPAVVSEDVIKRSLLHALRQREDAQGVVDLVTVARTNVALTANNELRRLEVQITDMIQTQLTTSTVQVTVMEPKEKTAFFLAYALFSDPTEGLAACRNLRGHMVLNQQTVEIQPSLLAILTVRARVMEMCSTQYQMAVQELTHIGVEVTRKEQRNGNYLVSIKATDLEEAVRARALLSDVIKGDVLEATPHLQHLLTPEGRQFLQRAEKEAGAYVCVDTRLRTTIAIHGSDTACAKVRKRIAEYLDVVVHGLGEEDEVTLKGGDNPAGVLKALITTHGDDLLGLREAAGLQNLTVDYRRHKLTLSGKQDSLQRAKDLIQTVKDELRAASKGDKPEGEDIECVVCLCPVDVGALYRLQVCAHPYCKGCLKRQVETAITDRKLPIICCQDRCEVPLAWRDLSSLSRAGHITLLALANAAISAYVLTNRHAARFCTTPDCPTVYRVTAEDQAAVFQCPECGVRTCTACHVQSHDGMTCAMLRDSMRR